MATQLKANNVDILPIIDNAKIFQAICSIDIANNKITYNTVTNGSIMPVEDRINFIYVNYRYKNDNKKDYYRLYPLIIKNGVSNLPISRDTIFISEEGIVLNIVLSISNVNKLVISSNTQSYYINSVTPTITFIDGVEEDINSTVNNLTILGICFRDKVPTIRLIDKTGTTVNRDIIMNLHMTTEGFYVYESVINKGTTVEPSYVIVRLDEDNNITEEVLQTGSQDGTPFEVVTSLPTNPQTDKIYFVV